MLPFCGLEDMSDKAYLCTAKSPEATGRGPKVHIVAFSLEALCPWVVFIVIITLNNKRPVV